MTHTQTSTHTLYFTRCEYLPRVSRRPTLAGVGGMLGGSTSFKIGTIKMFYHFKIGAVETTFVDILDHPVLEKVRGLYIIQKVPALQRGSTKHPVTATSTIYHIDSITSKILLAPHFTPELMPTRMCGIRMWSAR